ncbi:MAG: hypothetical protein EHM33_24370, partial [Chloroflexi bacterium]
MMHGGPTGMLKQDVMKPRNLGETLGRLGRYFGRFWYMIALAVLFVIVSTWTQVTSPELTGQATDCFLVPAGASAFAGAPQVDAPTEAAASTCYLATDDPSTLTLSRRIIYNAYTLGGFEMVDPLAATSEQRVEGLLRLILIMIGLFVLGAILTGATFFAMAWTG